MPNRNLVIGDTASTVSLYRQFACFMQTLDWRVSKALRGDENLRERLCCVYVTWTQQRDEFLSEHLNKCLCSHVRSRG